MVIDAALPCCAPSLMRRHRNAYEISYSRHTPSTRRQPPRPLRKPSIRTPPPWRRPTLCFWLNAYLLRRGLMSTPTAPAQSKHMIRKESSRTAFGSPSDKPPRTQLDGGVETSGD